MNIQQIKLEDKKECPLPLMFLQYLFFHLFAGIMLSDSMMKRNYILKSYTC